MNWSWRTTRIAIIGYLLIAALVIGGLTWATIVSVRLEQNRIAEARQAEFRRITAQAIARMDERVAMFMIRESRRPVLDYEPFSFPEHMWRTDLDKWEALGQGEVAERSELATTKFEPWLLFHFSVSATTDWSSPQIPTPDWFMVPDGHGEILYPIPQPSQRVLVVFSHMRGAYTPEPLGDLITEARAANPLIGEEDPEQLDVLRSLDRNASQRLFRARKIIREARAPEICDAKDLSQLLFPGEEDDENGESSAKEDVLSCVTSDFTGLWLSPQDDADPVLAFVRTVVLADGRIAYQGFILDWPVLRMALLEEISGLLPDAQLMPVLDHTDSNLETHMSWMPVRLEASAEATEIASTGGWTGLRSALFLIWIASLTVLGAVGLGVHALLDLAERRRQFAYAVSHELRTPLTTFRLYTDMLASGMTPPEKRDDYIQTLNEESQRLADLVGGVLEYSRLEAQAPNLAVESVAVRDLMEAAKERFAEVCLQHEQTLELTTGEADEATLQTDPDLVLQILGILVDNACKYAAEAEDKRIIISAGQAGADTVVIDVRDFGPGIARKNRRRVFEPFRRGVRGAEFGGIGLGLALARRWAGLIGGKLILLPTIHGEHGAVFRLSLPTSRLP